MGLAPGNADALVLLADAAQVVDNRLYILGGGWSVTGPTPSPFAIAMRIRFPGGCAPGTHEWQLSLHRTDGIEPAPADRPGFSGVFTLGPAGTTDGDPVFDDLPVDVALVVNAGPIPLRPGRYTWQLQVDSVTEAHWSADFVQT